MSCFPTKINLDGKMSKSQKHLSSPPSFSLKMFNIFWNSLYVDLIYHFVPSIFYIETNRSKSSLIWIRVDNFIFKSFINSMHSISEKLNWFERFDLCYVIYIIFDLNHLMLYMFNKLYLIWKIWSSLCPINYIWFKTFDRFDASYVIFD